MRIFISFKYETDYLFRNLLKAWNYHPNIDISFDDVTPREINSEEIGRVKAVLTQKVKDSDAVLVLIGEMSDTFHRDYKQIGYKNWQYFEIAKAIEYHKKIIVVKRDKTFDTPKILYNQGATWVYSFNKDKILDAINNSWSLWRW